MITTPRSPAEILADNLRRLMARGGSDGLPTSQAGLARKSGVAQKTISNWLAPERGISANIDKLDQVAAVYSLELWQLFVPDLPAERDAAASLAGLVHHCLRIGSARARQYLYRVAEAEADYTAGPARD